MLPGSHVSTSTGDDCQMLFKTIRYLLSWFHLFSQQSCQIIALFLCFSLKRYIRHQIVFHNPSSMCLSYNIKYLCLRWIWSECPSANFSLVNVHYPLTPPKLVENPQGLPNLEPVKASRHHVMEQLIFKLVFYPIEKEILLKCFRSVCYWCAVEKGDKVCCQTR